MTKIDRRQFLEVGGTAAAAALLTSTATEAEADMPQPAAPEPFRLVSAPVLQNMSADGVTVFWSVNGRSTGWVEYGLSPDALTERSIGNDGGLLPLESLAYRMRLTGLKPGATYHYRIAACPVDFKDAYHIHKGEAVYSPVYSFTTLSGAAAPTVSFSIINDTHEHPKTLEKLMPMLAESKTDLTFWNGDIFNDIRSEAHLADRILTPHAGDGYAASRPLFVVRGNHDVRGVEARLLDRFTDTPNGRYYYQFRQGPVAFLVLDSGEDKVDADPAYGGLNDFAPYRAEQRVWLEHAVQEEAFRSAPFRVVLIHIPMLGSYYGAADSRANFHEILAEAGVDLVISGHTHRHAYHPPEPGRPYPALVGGGPEIPAATLIHAHADSQQLEVTMQDLAGTTLGHYTYPHRQRA